MAWSAPATAEATSSQLDHLNADVVAEILLRLPSASVLRCRAVCRAWRDITSSSGFVAAYSRRRPLELVVKRHGANGVLTLDAEEEARRCLHPGYPRCEIVPGLFKSGYSLVGSCVDGGLLLFERFMYCDVSLFLVCNPVSRQWVIVPLHSNKMTRPCALYTSTGRPASTGSFCSPTTTSVTAGAGGRRTTSARSRLPRPGGCRVRRSQASTCATRW